MAPPRVLDSSTRWPLRASVRVEPPRDIADGPDAGPGGAAIVGGRGLAGMRERLRAFGGDLTVTSPPGGPTTVAARLPLLLRSGEPGVWEEGA